MTARTSKPYRHTRPVDEMPVPDDLVWVPDAIKDARGDDGWRPLEARVQQLADDGVLIKRLMDPAGGVPSTYSHLRGIAEREQPVTPNAISLASVLVGKPLTAFADYWLFVARLELDPFVDPDLARQRLSQVGPVMFGATSPAEAGAPKGRAARQAAPPARMRAQKDRAPKTRDQSKRQTGH